MEITGGYIKIEGFSRDLRMRQVIFARFFQLFNSSRDCFQFSCQFQPIEAQLKAFLFIFFFMKLNIIKYCPDGAVISNM